MGAVGEMPLSGSVGATNGQLDAGWLKSVCLEAGVDDAAFVSLDDPALAEQRAEIVAALPGARSLISLVGRLSQENIRSPIGSVACIENHVVIRKVDLAAHRIVMALEQRGIKALMGGPSAFPMEADDFPAKAWLIAHKPVAIAAGLGRMGLHRCIIHPKFGSFIVLGTIVVGADLSAYGRSLEQELCIDCKLCVEVCPVGAIHADGYFNFSACFMYNYRELMGGFLDWVAKLTDARNFRDYRRSVSDAETVSMWQGLAFDANFKSPCCCSVCPAGDDVVGPYRADPAAFVKEVVQPLQQRRETVYVIPGSDAEERLAARFPHKRMRRVAWPVRPRGVQDFLDGLPLLFQPGRSAGLRAVYHFAFTGKERRDATVTILDGGLRVEEGLHGRPDLKIAADSEAWMQFVAKEANIVWQLLRRKIRIAGRIDRLLDFKRCFPA